MLSRVAENIFWMSRYMERSYAQLMILRTHYIASQDGVHAVPWKDIIQLYSSVNAEDSLLGLQPKEAVFHLMLHKENDASIINNITHSRENARSVQDHITKEVWQTLNESYHKIRDPLIINQVHLGDPVTVIDLLIRQCLLYYGTADTTMARGEGFNFLNIGKFLERALQCVAVLEMQMNQKNPTPDSWQYLLFSLSGYEFSLKTYQGIAEPAEVLHQCIYHLSFPHSLSYCLQQLYRYFERLKTESTEDNYDHLDFVIGKTMNDVKYSNPLMPQATLMQAKQNLYAITNAFNKYYFGMS